MRLGWAGVNGALAVVVFVLPPLRTVAAHWPTAGQGGGQIARGCLEPIAWVRSERGDALDLDHQLRHEQRRGLYQGLRDLRLPTVGLGAGSE